ADGARATDFEARRVDLQVHLADAALEVEAVVALLLRDDLLVGAIAVRDADADGQLLDDLPVRVDHLHPHVRRAEHLELRAVRVERDVGLLGVDGALARRVDLDRAPRADALEPEPAEAVALRLRGPPLVAVRHDLDAADALAEVVDDAPLDPRGRGLDDDL